MGIRAKLSLEIGLVIIASFCIAGVFLYAGAVHYAVKARLQALAAEASEFTFRCRTLAAEKRFAELDRCVSGFAREAGAVWAAYTDKDNIVRVHSNSLLVGVRQEDLPLIREEERLHQFIVHEKEKEYRVFTRPVYIGPQFAGSIRAAFDYSLVRAAAGKDIFFFIRSYILACAATVVVGILAGHVWGFSIVRRVQAVKQGVEEISRGNLGYRCDVRGGDELSFLSRTFNDMSGKLQKLDQLKDDFIARISHELKSPVSVIRGFLEQVKEEKKLSPAARQSISRISYGTERLERLVSQTLDLSRIKAGRMDYSFEKIAVQDVVPDVVDFFKERLDGKDVKLVIDIPQDMPAVRADAEALSEVMANLLSNAIKFTLRGEIRVWAQPNGSAVTVGVTDTGIGIPAGNLDSIFEQFTQVKVNRQKIPSAEGAGLGLAVVKSIVECHGGTVHAESAVGRGTTVSFTLPQAHPVPVGGS